MDGCVMCDNTLTTAASQQMLLLLEDVFQVSIVANVQRALFVCSRCELNVHLIEDAMKLKREMEDHLLEALEMSHASGDGAGLPRSKRRRADDAAAVAEGGGDGQGPPAADSRGETQGGGSSSESVPPAAIALLKRPSSRAENGPYQAPPGFDAAAARYYGYATKRPRPFHQLGPGIDAHGRLPMGNGRLLLPHDSPASGGDAALRRYDAHERSLAAGGSLHHRTASSEMLQAGSGGSLEGLQGVKQRRRGGFPCHQCGKVMRTLPWLTRHLQLCGSDSPYDDMEGVLTDDPDSCSDDETDVGGDSKGDLSTGGPMGGSNGGVGDSSAPSSAMSTPVLSSSSATAVAGVTPAIVYKCKDCGKTFKRKTWLLKHSMQCVASRVVGGGSASSTPTSGLGGHVGSALTCNHCGKRYLGRYDKYREHVKLCSLRMNGGAPAPPAGFGSGGFGGSGAGGLGGGGGSFAPGAIGGGGGMATATGGSAAMSGAAAGGNGTAGGGSSSNVSLGVAENACHKCGESVPGGAEDLDRHVSECTGQSIGGVGGPAAGENTVHTCPHCGRCYAKRYDYFLRHVRSCQRGGGSDGLGGTGLGGGDSQAPGDGEPCVCPRCSKMYRRADHLWQHMEMCRGIPGRNVGPHVCDKCGKTYGTRYDVLQRHVLTCKGVAAQQPLQQQQQLLSDALIDSQAAAQRSIMGAAAAAAAAASKDGGAVVDGLGDRQVDGDRQPLSAAAGGGDALVGVPAPRECGKCSKVYVLRYDHFARHVSKCSGEQAHVCGRCGRDFGLGEYEQFVRHGESCDGGGISTDGPRRPSAATHVCPGCGKACETYGDLWSHVQSCPTGSTAMLPPPDDEDDEDEAAAGCPDDDGSGLRGGIGGGSGKMRNVCARCGKCYVLLTCYRKHVAKCMGIGDAAATNGGGGLLYNGSVAAQQQQQRAFLGGGGSSSSPSTGSNPADDELNELVEDDDEAAAAAAIGASSASYECDNCGMAFGARRASFLKHVALCTGGSVAFSSAGGSSSSAAVAAAMGGLHVCNYCGKHFVRLGNYTRHVQVCQYSPLGGGGGGDALLRQATPIGHGGGNSAAAIRQCDRCYEAMPAELFASHVERCYGAASRSAASLLMASLPYQQQLQQQQQLQAPPPTWTCPRCKKEFQQSGQYIRHISTCSMEFLKCPKCDFGRYYSDSKDFDNHVTACRGKTGGSAAAAGGGGGNSLLPLAGAATMPPTSASPLPLPSSVDRAGLAPFASESTAAGGVMAAATDRRNVAIPSDPASVMAAERRSLVFSAGGQRLAAAPPASVVGEEDDDEAVAQSMEEDEEDDEDDSAAPVADEFAAQEEVMAADGVRADCSASEAGGAEGSAAFGESAMLA